MTSTEFKYWLNGFLMLSTEPTIDQQQVKILRSHANLVQAISKHLDADIEKFILYLEATIQTNPAINLSVLKQHFPQVIYL